MPKQLLINDGYEGYKNRITLENARKAFVGIITVGAIFASGYFIGYERGTDKNTPSQARSIAPDRLGILTRRGHEYILHCLDKDSTGYCPRYVEGQMQTGFTGDSFFYHNK